MRGAAAAVLMEGSADVERETQDLRVVVVPEINAGTASLAYAFINPAIGLGTFLAQYFLRKPRSPRPARASSTSPVRGTIRRSNGSSAACSAPRRRATAGCSRGRRAAEHDHDTLGRGADEDRRPADGLDAERRAQPRRRPRARSREAAREGAELAIAARVLLHHGPKRPRQARRRRGRRARGRSRRCSPRRRASTGSGSSAARCRCAATTTSAGDERQPRLLAGRRAGRALRQDPSLPLRQRARAVRRRPHAQGRRRPGRVRGRRACASA